MTLPSFDAITDFLGGLAAGATRAFGEASVAPVTGPNPNGHGAVVLVRQGYEIKPLDGKKRNQRSHTFEDLGSFAAWLNRHADGKATEILVDSKTDQVHAALQPGVHETDTVTCLLAPHPRVKRWLNVFGQPLNQEQFHRLLVSCQDDFRPLTDKAGKPVGGTEGEWLAAQVSKLEVVSGGVITMQLDERGVTSFAGKTEKNEVTGTIPARIKIDVPWLIGVQPLQDGKPAGYDSAYQLEVFLRIRGTKEGPIFTVDCPNLEVVKREAMLDGVAWVKHLLKPDFLVGLGHLTLVPVRVVA